MSTLPYFPEFYDPAEPEPRDVRELMDWLAEHDDTYPDEAPELEPEPYEPDPADAAWWAEASNARPDPCPRIPPSAHGPEDLDGPTPCW